MIASFRFGLVLFHLLLFARVSFSQSVAVGTPVHEEYMRRMQLEGKLNDKSSFLIRPILPVHVFDREVGFDLDSTFIDMDTSPFYGFIGKKKKLKFLMMPVTNRFQYTSNYAFGLNDGPMIPNRGIQNIFSLGTYLEYGKFSIQLQPEFLLAQNKDYLGFPIEHQSTILYYYEYMNRIDMPERFGTEPLNSILPGQSSFRFNHKGMSLGISTENLWWGPGKRNSLLMSNNAPGFLHFTFNTQKPIKTKIGHFEGQLISGFLKSTSYPSPHSDYVFQQNAVLVPKRQNGDRYISGLILTYQPKWLPGLSLGYGSINHMYRADMETFADYLPVFNGEKGFFEVHNPTRDRRQQFSSGFFRWLSSEGHFEFYGEYGTNGNSIRAADFLITPERNRAFTLGFSTLIPLRRDRQFIQISSEMTQSGQTIRESIRNLDTWYIHNHVRHGYTHQGQVLGIGYGPAANVNWAELAWVRDFSKIAFHMERIVYNNDFYNFRFEASKDWRSKYVDLVPSLVTEWRFGNLLAHGNFQYVNTWNYKWYLENQPDIYFVPGLDRGNLVLNIGLTYILK
ncbi:capsule assembly Wzi family protein [Aquiflexum sp. LQ15W]|uniref:capsule assembly Wzi family protein n=1 Tax=Cognataquiflexum nitidum TaxID=2922272 RepID=UPI001F1372DC|nr:capsule assembly Wzi family protein [Cognataquiflexum nitidum]MCH6198997.1 capsule assembly Wzi family protein [Cognataquiflexum nitidum]